MVEDMGRSTATEVFMGTDIVSNYNHLGSVKVWRESTVTVTTATVNMALVRPAMEDVELTERGPLSTSLQLPVLLSCLF